MTNNLIFINNNNNNNENENNDNRKLNYKTGKELENKFEEIMNNP